LPIPGFGIPGLQSLERTICTVGVKPSWKNGECRGGLNDDVSWQKYVVVGVED